MSFSRRYSILKQIGEGGMGLVFLGRDNVLNREVAIKRLKISAQSEHAWLRFQQEALACAALRHPNIVSVFDFGSDEDAVPYIVLDYLNGQTQRQYLDQKTVLTFTEMFNIILPLLDGLEHAHNNGVVHRDLKPANIFLQRVEGSDKTVVKIMDFGIAKVISDRESGFETKTGEVFGSPYYISPEQISGDDVDRRADLYALGCVMFEMLTGKPPFVGRNILATFMMHKSDPPPPLSEILDGQPFCAPVGAIVDKLLQKDRSARYRNVAELKADLLAAQAQWADDPQRLLRRAGATAVATSIDNIYSRQVNEKSERSGTFALEGKNKLIAGAVALGVTVLGVAMFVASKEKPSQEAPNTTSIKSSKLSRELHTFPLNKLQSKLNKEGVFTLTETSNFDQISKRIGGRSDIKCIELQDMIAHDGSFKNLRTMPNLHALKFVDVFDLSTAMIEDIAAIKSVRRLEVTSMVTRLPQDIFKPLKGSLINGLLIGADLTENHMRDIAELTALDSLNLARCGMDMKLLAYLQSLKHLRYLRMEGSNIKGEELAVLEQMPKLTEVYINMNPLEFRSLKKLSPLTRIEKLGVFRAKTVGDPELIEICRVFPNLTTIDLGETRVSDVGVKRLAALKELADVDLMGVRKVTNEALESLSRAPKLKHVVLVSCEVDSAGIKQLMRSHSKLEITCSPPENPKETDELNAVAGETGCKLSLIDRSDIEMTIIDAMSEGLGK